ncbi:MAG: hypothetical protein JETT_1607 [Candidatus Jettenia ecosi]|uniref:Uncharacterized protein n=1 Tax=Candidatus Jettenia ecosi TaxID=2494326 RepID=A0A533QBM0_9BACT|nr:MAG: hypothetical protein JETT_1607 [Candidatus Jettenia ecosi]
MVILKMWVRISLEKGEKVKIFFMEDACNPDYFKILFTSYPHKTIEFLPFLKGDQGGL